MVSLLVWDVSNTLMKLKHRHHDDTGATISRAAALSGLDHSACGGPRLPENCSRHYHSRWNASLLIDYATKKDSPPPPPPGGRHDI